MIVLGLLLIILAGAAVVAVSWDEAATATTPASFTVFDQTIQLSQLEFFFAGAVTGALFLLGLAVMFSGMRRSATHRRKLRSSRMEARDRVARLEEEKRALERELEKNPAAPATPVVDRDRDGVDDRVQTAARPRVDRDHDGVDDRGETTAPHPRVEVPRQHSTDQLVAGRHGRPADGR
ncbi:LapA family protein [Streptosporangium roseum]|uniref:LapA family protein n=1 Tax=Streptosporangium roseum TaxID=2001 RepID=UPI0033284454